MADTKFSTYIPTPAEAKYSGKYAVQATSDDRAGPPPLVSPLYDTREEANATLRGLKDLHPAACVARWPTREEWEAERQKAEDESLSQFGGCYIYVKRNAQGHCAHVAIEGPYSTADEARARLDIVKAQDPTAYAVECWRRP